MWYVYLGILCSALSNDAGMNSEIQIEHAMEGNSRGLIWGIYSGICVRGLRKGESRCSYQHSRYTTQVLNRELQIQLSVTIICIPFIGK